MIGRRCRIGIEKSQRVLKRLIEDSLKKVEEVKCVVQHQIETGMLNGIKQLKQCFQNTAGEIRQGIEDLNKGMPEQTEQLMKALEQKSAERMEGIEARIVDAMNKQISVLTQRVESLESKVKEMNGDVASRLDNLLLSGQTQPPQD